jgi:hypothetical protein
VNRFGGLRRRAATDVILVTLSDLAEAHGASHPAGTLHSIEKQSGLKPR